MGGRPGGRVALVLALCVVVARAAPAQGGMRPSPALLALLAEFDRMAALPLWPGFEPRRTPLAIYDGTHTWLVRHPSPPDGYLPVRGRSDIVVAGGRQAEVTSNSSATIGGVPTATVMPSPPGSDARHRAGVAIHEAFHVFQRARHQAWQANEVDFFTYPHTDAANLAGRRREYALLRLALATRDSAGAACHAFIALLERDTRYRTLGAAGVAYERLGELNEGLATYVQMRAIGASDAEAVPDSTLPPDGVRAQLYLGGPAWGRLLDRFARGWRDTLERRDSLTLDGLLMRALLRTSTERPNCGLGAARWAAIDSAAARDAAGLVRSLAADGERFLARAGWRIVIDASRSPIFPAGFDPLNVRRVSERNVLHTRFVELANGQGRLHVVGRGALTESAGAHPMFSGARTVTIAGLDAEPVVRDSAGTTLVTADGVTARFARATVAREGQVVRVTLAPPSP